MKAQDAMPAPSSTGGLINGGPFREKDISMRARPLRQKFANASVFILLLFVCAMLWGLFKADAQNSNRQPTPEASNSPTPSPTVSPATPNTTATPKSPQANAASTVSLPASKVVGINTKRAGLGDLLTLRVENLATLVQQSKCVDGEPGCQKQEIILFINGRPLAGDGPEVILPEENLIQFHLSRAEGTDDLWEDLLGNPTSFVKEVKASVGLANGYPLPDAQPFELIVIQEWWFWGCFILLAAVAVSTIYLARSTTLLRNSYARRADQKLPPYSLGRTQMAFWFLLVVTSFVLIWLITGEYDAITSSTLVLIGIGAGTALGADIVDNNRASTSSSQLIELKAEQAALNNRINEIKHALTADTQNLPPNASDLQAELDAKQVRLNFVNVSLDQLQKQAEPPCSQGFIRDILNDSDGISFHRFQIVVWTIVLGVIFVESVYSRLAMPEFSGTLLALMGISSGTYLGFKGTEK
jgi:hypothetical protein